MVVSINLVLEKYVSILNGSLSYSDADRWAWKMMELYDNRNLEFEPEEKEELIWELISYLYGIDMPCIEDRTRTERCNLDIIDFLKKNNISLDDFV